MAVVLLQRKRKQARAVLLRILQIGTAVGLIVGVVAFAAKSAVPAVFTQDVTVSTEVQRVLPMIAMFMVSVGRLSVGRLETQCLTQKQSLSHCEICIKLQGI